MKKLTIIGGGPAGYAAALYASNFDFEVTLIESDTLGGTCLNRGCIPAKYWLHVAELNHEIENSMDFGIEITSKKFDWKATAQKRFDTVNKLVGGIGMLLKSKKVMKNEKIDGDYKTISFYNEDLFLQIDKDTLSQGNNGRFRGLVYKRIKN